MTSALERATRRRNVIRLTVGRKMSPSEVAEELGYSKNTILADIEYIFGEIDENGMFEDDIKMAGQQLLDHELQDLHDADASGEIEAKSMCKTSLRNTLKFLKELEEDFSIDESESSDELLEDMPDELKVEVEETADKLIDGMLEE